MHDSPSDILPCSSFSFPSAFVLNLFLAAFRPLSFGHAIYLLLFSPKFLSLYWLQLCTSLGQIPRDRYDGISHCIILLSWLLQLDPFLDLTQAADGCLWIGHTFFGWRSYSQSWGWSGDYRIWNIAICGWRTTLKGAMGLEGTLRPLRREYYLSCLIESHCKWAKL